MRAHLSSWAKQFHPYTRQKSRAHGIGLGRGSAADSRHPALPRSTPTSILPQDTGEEVRAGNGKRSARRRAKIHASQPRGDSARAPQMARYSAGMKAKALRGTGARRQATNSRCSFWRLSEQTILRDSRAMKLRHAATLALVGLVSFSVTGCGGSSDAERAQEPLQRQVAAGEYQRCVGNHPTDPG